MIIARPLCVAVIAASLLHTAVCAQAQVNWKVGDSFVMVERDGWKKETSRWRLLVTATEGADFKVSEERAEGVIPLVVKADGTFVRPKPRGGGTFEYRPVKLPLAAGSEWSWDYIYVNPAAGNEGASTRSCKAIEEEEIEVPAGKLRAWRFECRGSWNNKGITGSITETRWYSPALSLTVKYEGRSTFFAGSERYFGVLESFQKP